MIYNPLKIKVCGMRDTKNLEQLCSIGPDYIGFIFYPKSKRFVGVHPDPALFKIPPAGILKVGVFVNEQIDRVTQMVEEYQLELVQLHGNESPAYCRKLMGLGIQVIKAFSPGGGTTGSKTLQSGSGIEGYKEVVHTLLFDTPGPGWGGSGQKFDWSLLKDQSVPVPYILSGGIGPEDTEAIGKLKNENLMGIDLNSRFELSPGLKDVGLLNDFFMEIRN